MNKQSSMECHYRQNSAIVIFVYGAPVFANGASNFVYDASVFVIGFSVLVNGVFGLVNGASNIQRSGNNFRLTIPRKTGDQCLHPKWPTLWQLFASLSKEN